MDAGTETVNVGMTRPTTLGFDDGAEVLCT